MKRPVLLSLSLLLAPALAASQENLRGLPRIAAHLPAETTFVWALFAARPAEAWDGMMGFAQRFLPEEEAAQLAAVTANHDEMLGFSLRNDLLAHLGPELVMVVDLPDFDRTMGGMMSGEASPQSFLSGVGLLVGARDPEPVEATLGRIFDLAEASTTVEEGVTRVRFPTSGSSPTEASQLPVEHVDLFYASAGGLMALGFEAGWVRDTLAGRKPGGRLVDAADFRRVFSQLDEKPESMSYLNVPRLVERVKNSQFVSGALAASEDAGPFLELLEIPDLTGMGVGATAVQVEGGRRTTGFGPKALSGGALQAGILAAVLVPNFLDALDKAKQKRTLADMQTVSVALEAFALDNGRMPGPTDGWVPLHSLSSALMPDYLPDLPEVDGWGHPLQYLSDGESFRLASSGKDGVLNEDLTGEISEAAVGDYDQDLVLVDGVFARDPASARP